MQFAVQACLQGRAMPGPPSSAFHFRSRNPAVSRSLSSSPFLAPTNLIALESSSPLKKVVGYRLPSLVIVKAEAGPPGAYDRETFVDPNEAAKIAQVAKRLERTAGQFKRLGSLGFWGQLVCTVVSAVILAFSVVITGQPTAPVSIYLTAGGIAAAFVSVFWSFGYIRLAQKLRDTIGNPTRAPPRAEVVKKLRNGIIINLLGMGATLLGLQATVGVLVAKALTSSSTPYLQGAPQGYSPVLALDVFLVQASGNAILAHFIGLIFSLQLLRSVTLSQPSADQLKTA